ncbi:MAG: DUF5996 family protein, partial [Acidobacteriia bacterium]|nr:DUF5996 family protein [Terriglobia bacterium]
FILMYDDMRSAESPRHALMEFLESTYAAGAKLANWDRQAFHGRRIIVSVGLRRTGCSTQTPTMGRAATTLVLSELQLPTS